MPSYYMGWWRSSPRCPPAWHRPAATSTLISGSPPTSAVCGARLLDTAVTGQTGSGNTGTPTSDTCPTPPRAMPRAIMSGELTRATRMLPWHACSVVSSPGNLLTPLLKREPYPHHFDDNNTSPYGRLWQISTTSSQREPPSHQAGHARYTMQCSTPA